MNNQLEHERENTARISIAAVEVLQLFVQDPGWAEAYARITDRYKDAFMAFLLIPGLARMSAENLVTTFELAHCVKGKNREEATRRLLLHLGWTQALDALGAEHNIDGLLDWDEERLRQVLELRYAFVHVKHCVHVFDLDVIRDQQES